MRHLKHFSLAAAMILPMASLAQAAVDPPVKPQTPATATPDATNTNTPGTTNADNPGGMPKPLPKPDLKPTPSNSKKSKADTVAKADSIPSPGESLDPHIKAGSEADVNAIGTRSIGGRGIGNWFSTDWEIRVGKQYSMEIEKSAHLVTDPVVVEYVNRVGQNIVKNSDAKVPFTIKVIDSDEINAMALPGASSTSTPA